MSFEISVFSFFGKIDFWHLFLTVLFYPKTSPTFQYNLDYNIYLGEIMCVGRVWCPTKAELRPRPAAAWSTPRPPKDVNEISRNCVETENTSAPLFK